MHQDSKDSLQAAVMLGGMVFAASLLGIWARPIGFLSSLWPANALLLGCLLHRPDWLRPGAMLAVLLGYICADLLTDSRPDVAILLSMANMTGVGCAWLIMRQRSQETIFMQRQASALLLFLGTGTASLASACIGGPVLSAVFGTPPLKAFSMWISSEWMNYMIVLPPLLAWPTRQLPHRMSDARPLWLKAFPLLAVIALEASSYWMGGPGALAFSLPALLWCALSYRVFTLTLITSALCLSKTLAISMAFFSFTPEHFLETVSFRLGLCMLILGPLAVASAQVSRSALMRQLSRAVNYDFLTDVLTRSALLHRGQRLLDRSSHAGQSAAVLMLDLDHFKRVNDSYGHAAGDQLLRSFSQLLMQNLRPQDAVGRLGGEEFAAVLPQVDRTAAVEITERINQATRELRVDCGPHQIEATVSIGLVHVQTMEAPHQLSQLLQEADTALYQAKSQGRDRFEARFL